MIGCARLNEDREEYEELLRALGQEPGLIKGLVDEARAELLVEAMFGKETRL